MKLEIIDNQVKVTAETIEEVSRLMTLVYSPEPKKPDYSNLSTLKGYHFPANTANDKPVLGTHCHKCGYESFNQTGLAIHLRKSHGIKGYYASGGSRKLKSPKFVRKNTNIPDDLICVHCDRQFKTKQSYGKHISVIHGIKSPNHVYNERSRAKKREQLRQAELMQVQANREQENASNRIPINIDEQLPNRYGNY